MLNTEQQLAFAAIIFAASYLNDEGLSAPSGCVPDHGHVLRLVDEVVDAVEDAATGGGSSAVDAALVDGLAGDASGSVHVLQTRRQASALNPYLPTCSESF